ncbi:MAG TPA: hypothetical protein VJQ43_03730 [Thermoplasmata archaeon]|nr:hypothetical protein [Thermoplasmata archaeon]
MIEQPSVVSPRPGSRRSSLLGRLGIAIVLVGLGLGMLTPSGGGQPSRGAGELGASSSLTCNPSNSAPSALDIPLPNPTHSLGANGTVSVSLEVAAVNYTSAFNGTKLHLPSVTGVFPLTTGRPLSLYMGPAVLSLSGPGWQPSATESKTKVVASSTDFGTHATAHLTSARIAVMATAPYGTLQLQFRWEWTVTPSGGSGTTSGWTVPNISAASPWRASIFEPAPYVSVLGTSHQPAPARSNFTVRLGGAVGNASFRAVVEYPNNGTEIHSVWENASAGVTQFNVTNSLTYRDGSGLAPGTYLVHIHDGCEAIVTSISVQVVRSIGGSPAKGPGIATLRDSSFPCGGP